ncbi:helix-turn-helix domain-containing protein [Terrabacter sp. GCM10028922]|uniref:helix-turn-helix domain-containing protein n=1 Tax=Terrabacter sp. GCM10028922 TaxID=3273428 RepID=UPI003609EF72
MRGAGDTLTVGERIAFYRRRRGLTQAVLAGLVGRSEDWLSKIERGERPLRRLDVLADLAKSLRVTVGDLLGQPVLLEDEAQRDDDVPAVRDALMAPRRLSRVLYAAEPATSVDAAGTAKMAEHCWTDFQTGRIGRVVSALPSMITAAQALEDSATSSARDGWAVSARVHHLAASTMSKIGEADLAWIAAERAMHAADQSDDPLVLASAARSGTHALLSVGRYDDAMQLGQTAAAWLAGQVKAGDEDALSLLGMLFLRSATAAARHQDRAETRDLLVQAGAAADRLGRDDNRWQTGFGPTNVRLHKLSTALDLGDVSEVVERGQSISVEELPVERATAYQIDRARALSYVARDEEAMTTLLDAEKRAPQLVRHSAAVRETVRTMYRRTPATSQRAEPMRSLATRCRAVE